MKKLLLVTKSGKSKDSLFEYLNQMEGYTAEAVYTVKEAENKLLEGFLDLIIINGPLEEEIGDHLAIYAANHTSSGVIILLKNEEIDKLAETMEQSGIIVVNKPIVKSILQHAIKFAQLAKNRIATLQEENLKLQGKIDEIKLVNRAKWVLVQYLSMSEEQAHKYIEHQAMNRRMPKKKIAEKILKTYDH